MEKTTLEVYQHYGMEQDKKDVESGNLKGVDFLIGKEEDIVKLTRNMAGFGAEKSQRVTIEYDKWNTEPPRKPSKKACIILLNNYREDRYFRSILNDKDIAIGQKLLDGQKK